MGTSDSLEDESVLRPAGLRMSEAGGVCLLDCLHDARDELCELMQRWDNRLSLERLSPAKHYRECRLSLALKLKVSGHSRYAKFSATGNGEGAVFKSDAPGPTIDVRQASHGYHWNQQQVFVCDVHLVERQEGVVASLVRFDLVEDTGNDIGMGDLYVSLAKGTFHLLSSLTNRKLDVLCGPIRPSDELACDVINSGPQIVQGVADDKGNLLGEGLRDSELEDVVSGLRIFLDAKSIKISLEEVVQDGVQIEDVLLGPFNL